MQGTLMLLAYGSYIQCKTSFIAFIIIWVCSFEISWELGDFCLQSAVGPDSSRAVSSNRNLQHTQAQVEEEWSELDDWPEALQPDSPQFQTRADKLMRKYWWKNMEIWAKLIYVLFVIIVVVFIILVIIWISPEAGREK
ncbi:vesicle-associated membrane protein 3-like [Takifugu rubripes]|uniref:vesicle-associated membrane protein 3-like n=1 Tax=Takifugu rubripes TaxID=31033 RepID=UPI00114559ED|nr:vesicle-associated membrane protein 3-like [Takifugu rubripes]